MNSRNKLTASKGYFSHKSSFIKSITKMMSRDKGGFGKSITTNALCEYLIECEMGSFSIEFDNGSSVCAKRYLLMN